MQGRGAVCPAPATQQQPDPETGSPAFRGGPGEGGHEQQLHCPQLHLTFIAVWVKVAQVYFSEMGSWLAMSKPAQNVASALHHRSVFHQNSLNTHLNTPVFSQKGLNALLKDRIIFQNSLSNTFSDRLLTNCLPVFE